MIMLASYALVAMLLIAGVVYVFSQGGPMAVLANLTGGNVSSVDENITIPDNMSNVNISLNGSENKTIVLEESVENLSSNETNEISDINVSTLANETETDQELGTVIVG